MIYRLDEVDESLELLPMAARRALDRAGQKLSLKGWQSLTLEHRRRVIDAGSANLVDVGAIGSHIAAATPSAESIDPIEDPPGDEVPRAVSKALGPARPIPTSTWSALKPLDRYVLSKVAEGQKEKRINDAYNEIIGHSGFSSHLAPSGGVRMVDVTHKEVTLRVAKARSFVKMNRDAFERLRRAEAPKGDVLAVARIAGIMAAKRTSELIPLCHPVSLTRVTVELELDDRERAVTIDATAEALDRTGVEMEAMMAASVAALTVYDMLKSVDRGMVIGNTRVLLKSGGRSGDFTA